MEQLITIKEWHDKYKVPDFNQMMSLGADRKKLHLDHIFVIKDHKLHVRVDSFLNWFEWIKRNNCVDEYGHIKGKTLRKWICNNKSIVERKEDCKTRFINALPLPIDNVKTTVAIFNNDIIAYYEVSEYAAKIIREILFSEEMKDAVKQ